MKALLIALMLLCCSCQTTFVSPLTSTSYTGEISERGLSVTALPPFWSYCVSLYEFFTDEHQYSDPSP